MLAYVLAITPALSDLDHSDAEKGWTTRLPPPKAYRPVALLNTLGKILEAIIATRIA